MKWMRRITKSAFFLFLIADILVFSALFYLNTTVEHQYKVKAGQLPTFDTAIPVTAVYEGAKQAQSGTQHKIGDSFEVRLKAFGIIPFSTASVEVVDEMYVAVLGTPFGMKLYTEGVLVIDMSDVATKNGNQNPAEKAGIEIGDYIVSVDGEKIDTNEKLMAAVENSAGREMTFEISRDGKHKTLRLTAALSKETGTYKIGLWVRDSSAGIGTLTCFSPATGVVCGLGHGVCDEDTGELLEINSGEIVAADIVSVSKGSIGSPGELKGRFSGQTLGRIDLNADSGVYSILTGSLNLSRMAEVALKQEIKDGEAQILCTVEGDTPRLYDCRVKKRGSAGRSASQNLLVTVTDKELLKITGGIVQGMSGSPILQNGKLIGAVTHVLVDDPTSGFGIYAENMLSTAKSVATEKRKAS